MAVTVPLTITATAIEAGLRLVEDFDRFSEKLRCGPMSLIRPNPPKVRERGKHVVIDKVKVRYASEEDKYWAELVNFGHRNVHIPEEYVRKFDRLLGRRRLGRNQKSATGIR